MFFHAGFIVEDDLPQALVFRSLKGRYCFDRLRTRLFPLISTSELEGMST